MAANGDSEFGILTRNLKNRKNVPQKMRRYCENGDELTGDNSRVYCTSITCISFILISYLS
jgi:hypothetical protein